MLRVQVHDGGHERMDFEFISWLKIYYAESVRIAHLVFSLGTILIKNVKTPSLFVLIRQNYPQTLFLSDKNTYICIE